MPLKHPSLRLHQRKLVDEPLTERDWELVYYSYIGFQRQIEAIVQIARERMGQQQPASPHQGPAPEQEG